MRSRKPRFSPTHAPGYTLVEMLVVVMIAIMLLSITLPLAKSVMNDARPREAARILNTALFTAKARAASSGRLAGVELVGTAMPQGGTLCTQIYMCEVPALYMGDTTDARATVNNSGAISFVNNCAGSLPSLLDATNMYEIRFNHRGVWYTVSGSGNQIQNMAGLPAPAIGANGAIFQIRRPPVRVGNAIELPKSTTIDLTYSGIGPGGTEFNNATGVRIMFAPAGNLHSMSMATSNGSGGSTISNSPAFGTVHFLVGVVSKINPVQDASSNWNYHDPEKSNVADGNALWVSVGRNSGIITTNENNPTMVSNPGDSTQRANFFTTCRQFATNREQKGGL